MSKVLAVLDIQNLFLAARSEYGILSRIDFVKLKNILADKTDQLTAIAYVLVSPRHEDKKFIQFLKNYGFKVMRQQVQTRVAEENGEQKIIYTNSSWTSRMILEVHELMGLYDKLVIVSGNGGFISNIKAAKALNKQTKVVSFRSSLQEQLAELADEVVYLNEEFLFDENAQRKTSIEEPNVGSSENSGTQNNS